MEIVAKTRAFLSWLAHPLRLAAKACVSAVNMNGRQIQSVAAWVLIVRIGISDLWNEHYIEEVKDQVNRGTDPASPIYKILFQEAHQKDWTTFACIGAIIMLAVGAQVIDFKWRNMELSAKPGPPQN